MTIVDPFLKAGTEDGFPSIEQREWRITLNTGYNFGKESDVIPGFLGDLTIGGGVRWEDEVGIGFGVGGTNAGDMAYDLQQPFYGPSQTFIDVFARAEYELTEKSDLVLQVNIKDLTNHDDLVPFFANLDGSRLYRFLEGRLISLSVTVLF